MATTTSRGFVRSFATAGIVGCLVLLRAAAAPASEPSADHPIRPLLRYAERRLGEIDDQIKDYTFTLVRRERINGRLADHSYAAVKLRHRQTRDGETVLPFSVYMRFLGPAEIQGREVVYVEGRNDDKLIVRRGGTRLQSVTVAIDPDSNLATADSRYPITELGIRNLLQRLIEVGREELDHDEIVVQYFPGAKIDGRPCTLIQVSHPVRREHFRYHLARVFVDDELDLPIRYASYDWPEQARGQPRLIEEYTYLDLKLNVQLVDGDFDHRNDRYAFRKSFRP